MSRASANQQIISSQFQDDRSVLFLQGPCHVNPLIIVEKPKENNCGCQDKSPYRSMPFELQDRAEYQRISFGKGDPRMQPQGIRRSSASTGAARRGAHQAPVRDAAAQVRKPDRSRRVRAVVRAGVRGAAFPVLSAGPRPRGSRGGRANSTSLAGAAFL